MIKLRDVTKKIYILAYKEQTDSLERWFALRGFDVEVLRKRYSADELKCSAQIRCLLNHLDAWCRIAARQETAIVVEADFVPIKHFGDAPAPFNPVYAPKAIGWLYAGGPVLYSFDSHRFAIGHSSTAVALLITAHAAEKLQDFARREIEKARGNYVVWDTYLSHVLRREMNVPTYLPFRNHGEHGGIPNKEHERHGIRGWHQADRLTGSLAFMPMYTKGSALRYRLIRLRANLRGLYRILNGKYLCPSIFLKSGQKLLLLHFTIARWIPWGHWRTTGDRE